MPCRPDGIRVANVRVRRYRGFCAHNEQAKAFVARDLPARRASLLGIVDQTPQLEDRTRRERRPGYLGEFFDEIGSPVQSRPR